MGASKLAWQGFCFVYGLSMFAFMVPIAVWRDGAFTSRRKMSDEEKKELVIAQKKYWDLSTSPFKGFSHEFFTLKNGKKLHYVLKSGDGVAGGKNIAIFIHGFPDSYLLWRQFLTSPTLATHTLIAVDLPGYGGSDSLDNYGPEDVLEALAAFILEMRAKHLSEGGKVVMITHDWGSIVGSRLASEAKELADRWILTSGVNPRHFRSNIATRLASSKLMLHTWLRQPFNPRPLKNALATAKPVLSQIKRSFYIFTLNLPFGFANLFATFGNYWFLRLLHRVQAGVLGPGRDPKKVYGAKESADFLAISSGPGKTQFENGVEKGGYGESVLARSENHGMSEKIRYYQEGLLSKPWEKSLETVVALSEISSAPAVSTLGAGLFEEGPPGSFKTPVVIVYGKYDVAFDRHIALDGISDYLTGGSQVLLLKKGGHWLPSESTGIRVITRIVESALQGQNLALTWDDEEDVQVLVDKK